MFSLKKLALLLIGFVLSAPAHSAIIDKTLYINRGSFTTVNNTSFPYFAFNTTSTFDARNVVIDIATTDTLIIKILNSDTVVHGFAVQGISGLSNQINPADSLIDTLTFTEEGVYIYYDSYKYPDYRYMGAAGMICVSKAPGKHFYWNIKEHQTSFNNDISASQAVNWSQYEPDYFTINGLSHPNLEGDSTAKVRGNIGDTIRIFVANTGQSIHSIHFHGFHCKILFSSAGEVFKNRVKDTFSVKSMEALLLEMVPDKLGEYTVHDHNLVAVSGGGVHPNGMMVIMKIE